MMRRKKGIISDNRGSTLIEIIVSVLIIAIVFVPLLMGMSAALKANGKAEQELNSEHAAVNCMETVKALGKKGIAAMVYDEDDGHLITGLPDDPNAPEFGSYAKIYYDEAEECYVVTDIKEGLEEYSAKISFSDEKYVTEVSEDPEEESPAQNLFNDYSFVSFADFAGNGTRTIEFPEDLDEDRVSVIRSNSGEDPSTVRYKATWNKDDIIKTKEVEITIYYEDGKYKLETGVNYTVYNNLAGDHYFSGADTKSVF